MQDEIANTKSPEYDNNPTQPTQQQPQQFNPIVQPVYYPVYAGRPKVPGKGSGITSMIFGIFGIVYASMLSLIALQAILYSFVYDSGVIDIYKNMKMIIVRFFDSDNIENIIGIVFTCLVCTILAFVFAIVSRSKGYRNKISKSGLILSIISFALIFVFAVFTGYAYNNSPSKEINADEVKHKILGEWDCGDTGYLVINNDNTYYFYMENSKDEDNIVYGTYEATDGIATHAARDMEGITFITTIKKVIVDGVGQKISEYSKIQYAFTPDGTGNYDSRNLNTGSYFTMTKIK